MTNPARTEIPQICAGSPPSHQLAPGNNANPAKLAATGLPRHRHARHKNKAINQRQPPVINQQPHQRSRNPLAAAETQLRRPDMPRHHRQPRQQRHPVIARQLQRQPHRQAALGQIPRHRQQKPARAPAPARRCAPPCCRSPAPGYPVPSVCAPDNSPSKNTPEHNCPPPHPAPSGATLPAEKCFHQ